MSDSERDTHPVGDLATRTPPEGEPAVPAQPHPGPPETDATRDNGATPAARATPAGRATPANRAPQATPAGGGTPARKAPVTQLAVPSLLHDEPARPRVRIRKLRVFGVLVGLGLLAIVSTVFGMMMAVTRDLPRLEEPGGRNSLLKDRNGKELGLLTGNQKRIFLKSEEIAPVMKQAIIAIEDRRFYTNEGVDLRGIARALYQDIRAQKAVQGGSTITMQFVKNATAAQGERTLFNKLREAALAYQITRKWSKERILRNYLNTIYFGNGAYGIEAAARTYFGSNHPGCGEPGQRCAQVLAPAEAALIAGMVASPTGYDPLGNHEAAGKRRALVLQRMVEQDYITPQQQQDALQTSLPTSRDIRPPVEDTRYPYFTSWVKQQVVDKLGGGQEGARLAFEGGLTVETTLDSRLQDAAEDAVDGWLPYEGGPRASLVAIENHTGEVLAMVGGDDYATAPFNLATQGQRQPGSAFKPFVLAQALGSGISPDSTWSSRKMSHCVTRKKGKCTEAFEVNNYEDAYAGVQTLRSATTFSDNSVYAQVGIKVGTRKVARLARRMGIRTPVSHNFAMTLGGLRQGVTPLDMAHAYETFARRGRFTYGTMSPGAVDREQLGTPTPGPVGIHAIRDDDRRLLTLPNGEKAENKPRTVPVMSSAVADQVASILSTVVTSGTATRAQIPGTFVAGKTGTTENYGDAWFVGWTPKLTVAVWVGYPDELRPMETEFNGQPVAGGTYPAAIWKSFMDRARSYDDYREKEPEEPVAPPPTAPDTPATPAPTAPAPPPEDSTPSGEGGGTGPAPAPEEPAPEAPAPAAPPAQEAPPATQQAPSTGGGEAAPE
ncbi:MAG TPA: transglycosylase domain-containing protein [Solirubrobacteraceae bacterium]|nr:transglycosylase domain-containing protein [Solirubrobacteraceae bacterium]